MKLSDGDLVALKANGVELKLKAKIGKRLPKGVLFAPYHFSAAQINTLYKGEAAVAVQVVR
jgi:predicted molibdopterin-dependent oxidoreductase YjgC